MNLQELQSAVGDRQVQILFLDSKSRKACVSQAKALGGVSMAVKV